MGKSKAQKLAEAEGITLDEAKEKLAKAAEHETEAEEAEEAEAEPTEEAEPESTPDEAEDEPKPLETTPTLVANKVDQADVAREAQKRGLGAANLPKGVAKQVKQWLGPDRGVAGASEWDGKSITVCSYPDYQKQTFYKQAADE